MPDMVFFPEYINTACLWLLIWQTFSSTENIKNVCIYMKRIPFHLIVAGLLAVFFIPFCEICRNIVHLIVNKTFVRQSVLMTSDLVNRK
jgi:hypothetical protein